MSGSIRRIFKLAFWAALLVLVYRLYSSSPYAQMVASNLWGLNQLHYVKFRDKLKARLIAAPDSPSAPISTWPVVDVPTADVEGGFYDRAVQVRLAHPVSFADIRYTLDGSIPTPGSPRYLKPIVIDKTTVLRFRAFLPLRQPGELVTRTYFIGRSINLAVLSLVTDPANLWNRHSGIYVNFSKRGKKWWREVNVEFFSGTKSPAVRFLAELRIRGDFSRRLPKKSFGLIYNPASVNGADAGTILNQAGYAPTREVALRAHGASHRAFWHDVLLDAVYSEAGGLTSPCLPVMVFLNGQLWGSYDMHENVDGEYLVRRFGNADYDLIKDGAEAICGNAEHWKQTLDFFEKNDLSIPESFEKAARLVDIDNLIDFWLINIFAAKWDWPHKNFYCFRKNNPPTPWKWISWDSEQAFSSFGPDVRHNTLAWATRSRLRHDLRPAGFDDLQSMLPSTLIVRTLLKSNRFREQFITRFCDLQNSILLPDRIYPKLDSAIRSHGDDVAADLKRWGIPADRYLEDIRADRDFIAQRPEIIRSYFREQFQLGPDKRVELFCDPPEAGRMRINSITPDTFPWSGKYFEKTRITVEAKPNNGFRFVRWSLPSLGRAATASLVLNGDMKIRAVFRPRVERFENANQPDSK